MPINRRAFFKYMPAITTQVAKALAPQEGDAATSLVDAATPWWRRELAAKGRNNLKQQSQHLFSRVVSGQPIMLGRRAFLHHAGKNVEGWAMVHNQLTTRALRQGARTLRNAVLTTTNPVGTVLANQKSRYLGGHHRLIQRGYNLIKRSPIGFN